ncbi:hypothetical protein GCM10009841_02360 [Microlunatus panaciterrae]|uniref:Kinase n=1 Tax=Microlunatus panaciterrae TaxID=400768 RepID=A0ABS2RMD7_9ACTN|nr:putative kinase [Microlunatus panaciterrae]
MTSLIHLNGPPGIGKSTLAALYAERHPGTLNLDIDSLHGLVGGWRDPDNHTHEVLRPIALAMASTHLGGGRNVILPQYLARLEEIDAFEKTARDQGADFREVVLLAEKAESIARFDTRKDDSAWGRHNHWLVEVQGGQVMLAAMYDQLLEILQSRPSAVVVRSAPEAVEETYASLTQALLQSGDRAEPVEGSPAP